MQRITELTSTPASYELDLADRVIARLVHELRQEPSRIEPIRSQAHDALWEASTLGTPEQLVQAQRLLAALEVASAASLPLHLVAQAYELAYACYGHAAAQKPSVAHYPAEQARLLAHVHTAHQVANLLAA